MAPRYDHTKIEEKWIRYWAREGTNDVHVHAVERPYYNLMMFPYPSAEGLHIGNMFSFTGSDVHGRYMRARGYDVFEPMGFDAFGIHSENFALKVGIHPAELIPCNITRFRAQLQSSGFMLDWSHEVNTTEPAYYRWSQWIFVQLYKAGLAYQQEAPVNWCPSCKTVLSDEQAEGGSCERCSSPVERRLMRQWFFRITAYAERLLDHLAWIDWSPITKQAQRAWIGRDEEGNLRLHDWCISRQRYWGPPIPIIYCDRCGVMPVPEEQLPVVLPDIEDFRPDGSGKSPLARHPEFVSTTCPHCGGEARRETDVSDNFLDSAWYFLRYPSSDRDDVPFDRTLTAKWLPVDMYIGGNEHAVLHLMYTRFITMALHDLGLLPFEEPFKRFRNNGMITHDGSKISKSRGNVINPDDYVRQYGADTLRTYLMFMGSYQEGGEFSDANIIGVRRFLERVWRFIMDSEFTEELPDAGLQSFVHAKINKVTEDIEGLRYNTAIAAIMELLNGLQGPDRRHRGHAVILLQLLAPFAPFITQELWERLSGQGMICDQSWPEYDRSAVHEEEMEVVIQVNGKVRGRCLVTVHAGEEEVMECALQQEEIGRWLDGKAVQRVVYIPGRVINFVQYEH